MKSLRTLIPFLFAILNQLSVHAADFDTDLHFLFNASIQSEFSTDLLQDFQNPYKGYGRYLLTEDRAPWAGNYFPMKKGGLANRWQKNRAAGFVSPLPTFQEVSQLSLEQIDSLSPAEKFDLYVGDYQYSMTQTELSKRGPQRQMPPEEWEGFCNGVRCAGILMEEPQHRIDVVNPDGIKIRFQPADLKALAGASYFYVEKYSQIGAPSQSSRSEAQPNAAVFDMALRFYLSHQQKSFVIDSHLGPEIWNESVVGYSRTLSAHENLSLEEKNQFPKATQKVEAQVELFTLSEMNVKKSNRQTKFKVAAGQVHKVLPVSYSLYLDAHGKAVDGVWNNKAGTAGVDFAWFGAGQGTDSQNSHLSGNQYLDFEVIKKLFEKASGVNRSCKSYF